jgi:tRNA-binding EMAP/Myf-like protein
MHCGTRLEHAYSHNTHSRRAVEPRHNRITSDCRQTGMAATFSPVIVSVAGALVGEIVRLQSHPNASKIWLAYVRTSRHGLPEQIVFGGTQRLGRGDLVAVAPPGSRVTVRGLDKPKKMRARNYRGVRSVGMLCSLNELGWAVGGPDEVALLRRLRPGYPLDELPAEERRRVVLNWGKKIEASDTIMMAVIDNATARPPLVLV